MPAFLTMNVYDDLAFFELEISLIIRLQKKYPALRLKSHL